MQKGALAKEREPQAMGMIEIRNLSKVFATDKGEVLALDDVSLSVQPGEIYGIIGMSGAGKTTLVRCMNFLERPSAGEVWIDGKNLCQMNSKELREVRRQETMIFQHFNLLMQETVEQNIAFALDVVGIKGQRAKARVEELLEIVGLPDKREAYPAQLSGGQKQRIAIARALASNPKILLCDEATSALDPMTTRSILNLIKDINERLGITIVVITHEMSVIREICHKVAVMDGARVVEEGHVSEVFSKPQSQASMRLFYSSEYAGSSMGKRYRLVFDQTQVDRPILAGAINACSAPINIVYANVQQIEGKSMGQMIIELPQDERGERLALDYLKMQDIIIEEVSDDTNA